MQLKPEYILDALRLYVNKFDMFIWFHVKLSTKTFETPLM